MNLLLKTAALALLTSTFIQYGTPLMAQTDNEAPSNITETYSDWTLRCVTAPVAEGQEAVRSCEIMQEQRRREGNQLVLAISLQTKDDGAGAGLTMVLPFGLDLAAGVSIAAAEEDLIVARISTCLPRGCIVATDLPQETVDTLAETETVTLTMTSIEGQKIQTAISLKGFAPAWNRVNTM